MKNDNLEVLGNKTKYFGLDQMHNFYFHWVYSISSTSPQILGGKRKQAKLVNSFEQRVMSNNSIHFTG